MMNAHPTDVAVTIRMDGSDMLIRALNDHMATCSLAHDLALELDRLREENASLRLRYEGNSSNGAGA